MLGKHRLAVDRFTEAHWILEPYADEEFALWSEIVPRSDTVYILGREILSQSFADIFTSDTGDLVFCNLAEGSETIEWQMWKLGVSDLVQRGRLGLMHGGDALSDLATVRSDIHFTNIVDFASNQQAHAQASQVRTPDPKPYSFLMLNGRLRLHRKRLIDLLRSRGLLEQALWTNLQSTVDPPTGSTAYTTEPIRLLPPQYEIESTTQPQIDQGWVKPLLFAGLSWGDAVINPRAYIDSYFSLVTETVFNHTCSFLTEKTWKPMIMCHPFVIAANPGFYRDLRRKGFQTFSHVIDESFDLIENEQDRARRIVEIVQDICYNGASDFLMSTREQCEHNYQQLQIYTKQQRQQLVIDLEKYLDKRS